MMNFSLDGKKNWSKAVAALLVCGLAYVIAKYAVDATSWFATLAGLVVVYILLAGVLFRVKGEALGLPSGSVRAMLALAIIGCIFGGGYQVVNAAYFTTSKIDHLPQDQMVKLIDRPEFVATAEAPKKPTDPVTYTVTYRSVNQPMRDVGLQVVTALLATLSSVVAFYFAASSVSQATQVGAAASQAGNTTIPSPAPGTAPTNVSILKASVVREGTDGNDVVVGLTGTGLSNISHVELKPLVGQLFSSAALKTTLTGDLEADFSGTRLPAGAYYVWYAVASNPAMPTLKVVEVKAAIPAPAP